MAPSREKKVPRMIRRLTELEKESTRMESWKAVISGCCIEETARAPAITAPSSPRRLMTALSEDRRFPAASGRESPRLKQSISRTRVPVASRTRTGRMALKSAQVTTASATPVLPFWARTISGKRDVAALIMV